MRTICVIDPSPTARAALAAGLRQEFVVLEGPMLRNDFARAGADLVVIAAEALGRETLEAAPFASLPFLILGDVGGLPQGRRTAPLRIVGRDASPTEVLAHARAILEQTNGAPALPPDAREPPFVPAETADRIRRLAVAHRVPLPVLVVGEPGTGKRTAARALHAAAGLGSLVRVTPLTAEAFFGGGAPARVVSGEGPLTLLIDRVEGLPGVAQATLVDCLVAGGLYPAGVPRVFWLLATACTDLCALAERGAFDPALAARLNELVVVLPPLRTRPHDIEAIAGAILGDLGHALGRSCSLAPQALERLRRHSWPGNVGELVAVLRRSALLAAGAVIGEHDLVFSADVGGHDATTRADGPPVVKGETPAPALATGENGPPLPYGSAAAPNTTLELVLTQLAHELKNPMVTIKTFAQHLPALLEDAELRERFASLADEAIDRMDGLLDNVLDFARLGPPRPDRVSLTRLVDGALEEAAERLATRNTQVRREGWDLASTVLADEAQVAYAFRNLFDSLVTELPPERELHVELASRGTVCVRFNGSGGLTAKLQSFLDDGLGIPAASALPLRVALARAVITRNGGDVAVEGGPAGETRVTITLPATAGG
jgi:DNA-binding NtrC family response regulator